ncbi:flagellar hook assembly protein FlgD [Brevibacillus sp. TJ4]|uniref:flagellar hook assembly protein FlgD n=1 Tax=Brevibacillus sp. TJ4 TaxID=3234853 RepID=UPI0037D309CD
MPVTSLTNTSSQSQWSYKGKKEFTTELDQNAFMMLMLEQLKHQDPLSPMDNSQFLQQTSMMTMVEKITKMASLMEQSNNSMLTLEKYEALVGRTATYDLTLKNTVTGETSTETKHGAIEAVYMDNNKIYFRIAGEATPIPLADVKGLESKGMTGNALDSSLKYMNMIGSHVSYVTTTQGESGPVESIAEGTIIGFAMKNGTGQFQLDNGATVKLEDIVGMSVNPDNSTMSSSLQYAQMIGYTLSYNSSQTNADGTVDQDERSGIIQAVSMKNGLVEFVLEDGEKVSLQQVIGYEAQRW